MHDNSASGRAVDFLLSLAGDDTAGRVRRRIGLERTGVGKPAPDGLHTALRAADLPSSVLLWMLEEDDPRLNPVVEHHRSADDWMRRAIARGVPFGRDRTTRVRLVGPRQEPPVPESFVRYGLVGALRAATGMRAARSAASLVLGPDDWRAVAEADRERALPGYARWALSVRPDCPPALRAQFGSHRKFLHRVRRAGVLEGPGEYATTWCPARDVMGVPALGPMAFPTRVREAEDALRPLVRDHLGDREEAWAILARLVDTYYGTVPELVMTAGAIA